MFLELRQLRRTVANIGDRLRASGSRLNRNNNPDLPQAGD
jgi:hypothetical protein